MFEEFFIPSWYRSYGRDVEIIEKERFKYLNVFMFLHIKMVSITLSIPEEIRRIMKEYPEINWSGYIRKIIEEKAKKLEWKKQMLKQLEAEEEPDLIALQIGDKIKQGMLKRYKKEGW